MARTKKNQPELATVDPLPPKPVDAGEHLETAFREYALYVIGDRALPSVADGLKPSHRRLLWGASQMSPAAVLGSPTVKCARITGETMAKYHPHGDSYLTLVRLAQPFAQRVPVFDFQGNMGSPDFGPAASRYTEARVSAAGMALLAQVKDGTVDLIPNYDGLNVEPAVLPAGFPNLLVAGSLGIAVGMSSNIPTHNPLEVVAAARMLIDNPKATVDELMTVLPGPDYPDPCQVINVSELADVYRSGSGQVKVRGIWHVEDTKRGQRIVVTSLPYADGSTGSSEKFIAAVIEAVNDGKLMGIDNVVNETAKDQTRIVIDVAKGVAPEQIVPGLLKFTNLHVTNPVRMNALDVDGVPQTYNLRTCLAAWIAHRVSCIERRSLRRIDAIRERLHLLNGLRAVLLDIDAAIAIIRSADDVPEARAGLMTRFALDEVQSSYVLDLTLRRLTRLANVEIDREHELMSAELARLEKLVSSPARLRRQVGVELDELAANLFPVGDDRLVRRTVLQEAAMPLAPAAVIVDEPLDVVLTADGYVQAFKLSAKVRDPKGQIVVRRVPTSTASQIVFVTDRGQLHRVFGNAVPTDKSTAVQNLIQMVEGERLVWWGPGADLPTDVLLVMSDGQIKRIAGEDLAGGDRKGGITVVKLGSGVSVVSVSAFDAEAAVLLVADDGLGIRFRPEDVRPMGRTASGVRGMKLSAGASVVAAVPAAGSDAVFVVAHAKGQGKRVECGDVPLQGRAGKGVKVAPVSPKSGKVSAACLVPRTDMVTVRTQEGDRVEVSAGAFPLVARDAAAGKVRNIDTIIVGFE